LGLSSCYPPFGDGRTATAGRDDDVTFTGDGRQSHDAVESEKRHTHPVQIATYNSGMNICTTNQRNSCILSICIDLFCVEFLHSADHSSEQNNTQRLIITRCTMTGQRKSRPCTNGGGLERRAVVCLHITNTNESRNAITVGRKRSIIGTTTKYVQRGTVFSRPIKRNQYIHGALSPQQRPSRYISFAYLLRFFCFFFFCGFIYERRKSHTQNKWREMESCKWED
jgi:hypothetical protein